MDGKIYRFEDYLLDVAEQRLQKDGVNIQLPPKAFDVLAALISRHGQLVTGRELLDEVWRETFVEEANLRYTIHTLRKTFPEKFIETVPKRGYRFTPAVESFTKEEFIRLHTGSFKKSELLPEDAAAAAGQSKTALAAYAAVAALVCLLTAAGLAAFYFWRIDQKKPANSPAPLKTVAVLPFTVIGRDAEKNGRVQRGLADAIAFHLGRIRGVEVAPLAAVDDLFGKEFDAATIGKKLGTEEFLTGTYREEENFVRISFRFVRAADGATLLNKSFTLGEGSQLERESAVALQIARQFDLGIARLRDEARIKNLELSADVRQNYLIARRIPRENEFNRWQEATDLMKRIVEQMPDWAPGHAGYAESLVLTHGSARGCESAPAAAERALELDASVAEAYLVLGICHQADREWDQAERNYRRAIELDPLLDRAYIEYGVMLDLQRRFAEAEMYLKKALELEPFVPFYNVMLCDHYYFDTKYAEALKYCREAQKIEPGYWQTAKRLQWIYVQQERYDEVEKLLFGKLSPEEKLKNAEAKALLDGDTRKFWTVNIENRLQNSDKKYSPVAVASFYAKLGDKEKTLEYLEKAAATFDQEIYRVNANPIYGFLRNEPRYLELLKSLNLLF